MASLFEPTYHRQLVSRIQALSPASQGRWGKMTVGQMLAHLQQPMLVATGDLQLKHHWIGKLIGGYFKRSILSGKPLGRNSPTAKEYLITDERDFTQEQAALLALLERFHQGGPAAVTKGAHPFFGKLTSQEWDVMLGMHFEHHLGQFGG